MAQTTKEKLPKKYIIIGVVVLILVFIIGLSIRPIMNYFDKKQVASIIEVLNSENEHKNVEQCKAILTFDKSKVSADNEFFDEKKYDKLYLECDENYNLKNVPLDLDNCRVIIRESENYFKRNYVFYSNLEAKKVECSKKYLNPTFSTGTFFDINNNFKTQVFIDFELDFFRDVGNENSDEYIENRVAAKKRLIGLLQISPEVEIPLEDVYLYQKRAILNLSLSPLSTYTISLLPYETDMGESTEHKEFTFKTPENKYFGMRVVEPLTIYTKNNLPNFEIIDYNTEKTQTTVELCNVSSELYAEVEMYLKTSNKELSNDYFVKWMKDSIDKNTCANISFPFKDEGDKNKNEFIRKDFSFKDFSEAENPTGLFLLHFPNNDDIEYNGRINKPILFGVANSHIMMKVSREGDGFFFVNDFDGKPLANQEISVSLNDYQEYEQNWDRDNQKYDIKYNLPVSKKILGDPIILGTTDENGVLKVDLKGKVDDYFVRTFEQEWEYDWTGLYKSFFVTSKGENHQSYLTSTWNAGIAPWNFGYTTDWVNDENQIQLQQWGDDRKYNAHIYTDRKLYLPGEEVNIKSVIRNWSDLSIPKDTEFTLVVNDAKGEEVLSKKFKLNDYGSASESMVLSADAPLGAYSISVGQGDSTFFWSGFSVEVFKNPKFYNEVLLETSGLNGELVNITDTKKVTEYYWSRDEYTGKFKINGTVSSKYYNGGNVKNADFTYKVYKQYYYDNSYWDDCYYGCYWEPYKEFYTEGKGKIDENGFGKFSIDVDFSSNYSDYKYIVEVTVTDDVGDTITGSNSIIARLPAEYKKYNSDLDVYFESDSKFSKVGDKAKIVGGLNVGDWSKDYNNKYVFAIKRKEYLTDKIVDANGYTRTVQKVNEIVERVFFVNYENFKLNSREGKIELDYKLDENAEYVFEYGPVDSYYVGRYLGLAEEQVASDKDIEKIIKAFDTEKVNYLENEVTIKGETEVDNSLCETLGQCDNVQTESVVTRKLNLSEFIGGDKYFTIITYDNTSASNPIENDNKLRVIAEKVSYNIGEKAKVLIRLPISNSKILWTLEKNGVVEYEYIDVPGNVFFKEFTIDDSYAPNSYIGVMMVDTRGDVIPEYKVGYAEIVIDKTDKKSFVEIKSNKDTYKPREEVTLDLTVKDKNGKAVQSELTVMVVDDSLISLMGNVDLNTLEKIFVKLPFSVQTSITNIAMLKNYYFSRMGIVGGSGEGDNKGGDSAVSTRNIFKNTAYYNPEVITDANGKAQVKFTLPDNLTNFRVMAVSNSKDNHFGYSEEFINVRKNVLAEDRTPLILRDGDNSTIGANIFNNSGKNQEFKVSLVATGAQVNEPEQTVSLKTGENTFVSWNIVPNDGVNEIDYMVSVAGDSTDNSDKIQNKIVIEEDPTLIRNLIKTGIANAKQALNLETNIPKNTDKVKTKVELSFSNSRLAGIEKIVASLSEYPYGCIEQTVSSTLPNVIVKQFEKMFEGMFDMEKINKNIEDGLARILSMQNSDGGFVYWQGSSSSDLHITPYVLRSLIYMKEAGVNIPEDSINNAIKYLEDNYANDLDDTSKTEIYWALSVAGKKPTITIDTRTLSRHNLIAYAYGLISRDDVNKNTLRAVIEQIKGKLTSDTNQDWYWDTLSDKALFAGLLLDNDDTTDNNYIEELITNLYTYDWASYYYSTQSKNNAFMAFYKYLDKTGVDNVSQFTFKLGNYSDNKTYDLGGTNPNIKKFEFTLNNVTLSDKLALNITNNSDNKIYVDYVIKQYPEDKLLVEPYSNGMTIKREYFEVADESLLDKCSDDYWYEENKVECQKAFTTVEGNQFKKGQLYKTRITVTFPDDSNRRLLTVEDYLPGTFRVINSGFRTESSAVRQAGENWRWSYKEFNAGVVMANATYVWGKETILEYYFRPEFEGTYTLPPVTAYMMYDPLIRVNGRFGKIEVK